MNGILYSTIGVSDAHGYDFGSVSISYIAGRAKVRTESMFRGDTKKEMLTRSLCLDPWIHSPDEIGVSIALTLGHDEARSRTKRP